MRNGVEDPPPLPAAHVERSHMSGSGCRGAFSGPRTQNEQVLIDDAGRRNRISQIANIAIETFSKVYETFFSERRDGFASVGIQSDQLCPKAEQDAAVSAALPISHTATYSSRPVVI